MAGPFEAADHPCHPERPGFDLNEFLAPHEVGEKEIDQLFESALQLLDLSHPDEGLSVE